MNLIEAHTSEHTDAVRAIFNEYADSLGFHLCFQDFEREIEQLPGDYAPPMGRLFLAVAGGDIAGSVALRQFQPGVGELKRMYVRPRFRGTGLGRTLAIRVIDEARKIGYERIWLDTLPTMEAAVALYESLGFQDTNAYRENPIEGARFMELELTSND